MAFGDWLAANDGKHIDVDGDGSFDCVDVAESWVDYVYPGVSNASLLGIGDAKDLYGNANPQYFDKFPVGNFTPGQGDIAVWGSVPGNPFGHIAVVIEADSNGINVLEENTFTQEPATRATHSYGNNLIGFLRPKAIEGEDMYNGKTAQQWAEAADSATQIAELRAQYLAQVAEAAGDNPDHPLTQDDVNKIVGYIDTLNKQVAAKGTVLAPGSYIVK